MSSIAGQEFCMGVVGLGWKLMEHHHEDLGEEGAWPVSLMWLESHE